jgi:hypothetical protein
LSPNFGPAIVDVTARQLEAELARGLTRSDERTDPSDQLMAGHHEVSSSIGSQRSASMVGFDRIGDDNQLPVHVVGRGSAAPLGVGQQKVRATPAHVARGEATDGYVSRRDASGIVELNTRNPGRGQRVSEDGPEPADANNRHP